MSNEDRERWNGRYAAGDYGGRTHPCALLKALLPGWEPVVAGARALDLACGAGRNAIFLATKGYSVDALDISAEALARGADRADKCGVQVNWQEQDLDKPLQVRGYDLIVVVRYADLELVKQLPTLLNPDGRLLVEAHLGGPLFTQSVDETGKRSIGGPGSERFRLAPGSLAASCSELKVLHSLEARIADPDGRLMALAQFVGQAPS